MKLIKKNSAIGILSLVVVFHFSVLFELIPIEIKDNEQASSYRGDSKTNKYQGFVPKELNEVNEFTAKNPTEFNQPES